MKLAEQNVAAPPGEVQALQEAFARFCEQTAELEEAYARLQEKAERINLQLDAANRELERKVRELDEVSNFQRSILESIPTAVVVSDLDGTVRMLNPAGAEMWGVSREQALGKDFREVMGAHGEVLGAVLAGRCRRETVRREVGGREARVISSTACLVEDSAGRPIGAIQVDRDMTRLCMLESQLRQHEKLADLGKMAAGLAHEIRKPLNGIKGFASILGRSPDRDSAERRYIAHIMSSADRLNGMLGRLLDFARPDDLRLGRCDLRAEAQQVAEFVRAEEPGGEATVAVEVPEAARFVLADGDKVKQVLLNLVKNGVEALEGPGRVTVRARAEPGHGTLGVHVEVMDTGKGIAAEDLGRLGEPFYTDKEGGTGLGLAIVRRILQMHGTEPDITSRPGEGTTVGFFLTAAPGTEER